MKDDRDLRYRTDDFGQTWATDADGNDIVIDGERIPGPAERHQTKAGFHYYDSSRGHCALCGRLTCQGNCFK